MTDETDGEFANRIFSSNRSGLFSHPAEADQPAEADRTTGNHVPREGSNPAAASSPSDSEFARDLFSSGA